MLKKLAIALTASAFMFAAYSPSASACPNMGDDTTKVTKKDDKKQDKKQAKKKTKKKKKTEKKPAKVG